MGQSALLLTFAPELLECFLGAESLLKQPGEAMALVEFLVTDATTGSRAVLTAPQLGTWGGEAGQRCRCPLSVQSASPGSHLRPHTQYLKGPSIQTAHSLCKLSGLTGPICFPHWTPLLAALAGLQHASRTGLGGALVPHGLPAAF